METLYLAAFFALLAVIGIYLVVRGDKKFEQRLKKQNLNIIFVNFDELNIVSECFKKKSFFKYDNHGKELCETDNIEFIRYSVSTDYFMEKQ